MVDSSGQAGTEIVEIIVTRQMREAGAWAIEDLLGAGSFEDQAEAAYRAMVSLRIQPKEHHQHLAHALKRKRNINSD